MKSEKLVLIVFICTLMKNSVMLSENIVAFPPTDLYTWCPHTSFCEQSQVDPDTVSADYGDDVVPCCSSCSCSEDCGRKRNCCKYEYDLYRLDETLDTICKQLNTVSFDKTHYHIVRACPDRSEVCDSDQIKDYNPAYSHETGMLYYNPACAECHGQVNVTTSKRLIICPQLRDSYFASASDVKKGIVDSDCELKFILPNDLDLSTEVCHNYGKQECNFKDFNGSEIYDKMCKSFNATFHGKYMSAYYNVYCFLCSSINAYRTHLNDNLWSSEYVLCPKRDAAKGEFSAPFSLLLDQSDEQPADEVEYPVRKSCINVKNEVMCRPMICPEGQVYLNGICHHLGSVWYFKHMGMSIYLSTPKGAGIITEDDLLAISFTTGSKTFLERPGFEDWDLTLMYNVNSQKKVQYFVALLFQKSKTIVPGVFLSNITASLNRKWKLHVNGQTFNLAPSISKYTGYISLKNDSTYLPTWYLLGHMFGDAMEKNETDLVRHYLGDQSILEFENTNDVIYITKVHFCTLIELENQDWVDWTFRIYLLSEDKFIEDGEFTLARDEYGIFRARICLEGFQQSGTRALVSTIPLLLITMFCFLVK